MLPVLQHCALWSHMFQSCFHPIEIEVDAPSTLTSPSSNHMRTARIDAAAGHDEDDALSVDVGGACPRHLTLHVAGWATVHIDVGAESVPAAGAADSASHANDATVRIEHVTSTSISGLAADAASGRNRGNACSDAFATRALRRAQFSLPLLLHYLLRAEA